MGLPPIRICAVATSGFLPEAEEPRISPSLPSFPCLSHLGISSPPVTHCPSLLWVPEQLLCLQSDLWGFYRPWLLGPTLPQLVDAPGCGYPSSGCLVPACHRNHGGGPGCPRAHAAGRRSVFAAGPQEVLRIPAHKLKPIL
ncbi:hypothetical protein HJG60_009303 [Phyllostomus discolor]|uniref:Uncharacterized protein n=1 Tax=Phyllostomus discolor TaxID=89673 RepID=A0A834DCD8_9CHIR|nr:hypothetical protein HJG60_009303 [Phyllostomus discolor]